jgi:hypothetical protein
MNDLITAIKQELKSPLTTHVAAASAGAIVVAALHYRQAAYTLVLGKDAFNALVNDETNFVRFASDKHEHAFRVFLEQ